MVSLIFHVIFSLLSIYFLLRTLGFALYEIKEMNNKSGGIVVISFSILVVIFSNIIMWII